MPTTPRQRILRELSTYRFVQDQDFVALQTIKFESSTSAGFGDKQNIDRLRVDKWCLRAGPRKNIYFNPPDVTAAIVTCGGLCPGLNDVIQHLVFTLLEYGVREENILGIMCAQTKHRLFAHQGQLARNTGKTYQPGVACPHTEAGQILSRTVRLEYSWQYPHNCRKACHSFHQIQSPSSLSCRCCYYCCFCEPCSGV